MGRSRTQLVNLLRVRGLQPTPDAIKYLQEMQETYGAGARALVDNVVRNIDRTRLKSAKCDRRALEASYSLIQGGDSLEAAAAAASDGGNALARAQLTVSLEVSAHSGGVSATTGAVSTLSVVDAFDVPKWKYDNARRAFYMVGGKRALFASAADKLELFRDRFRMVEQRVLRNVLFEQPVLPMDEQRRDYHRLTPINSLLGAAPGEPVTVLGVLTQPEERGYYIEDLNAAVRVDLSEARCTPGLFAENCIVLALGVVRDDVFCVSNLGMPPAESRHLSLENMGIVGEPNFFGSPVPKSRVDEFKRYEHANEDANFVILSDVELGRADVMRKLAEMFEGYASAPPSLFILIGNFCTPTSDDPVNELRANMAALGDLIVANAPIHAHSRFVFVPGPLDPSGASVNPLPHAKLPHYVTAKLSEKLRANQAIFTTNPARIRYCTQEIVIFRSDLVNKMRRHCVKEPCDPDEQEYSVSEHLVKTLIDQSHMCPLPLHVQPVYWSYDNAMHLYPLPHVLVLADRYPAYEHVYDGCLAFNPGSFPLEHGFVSYSPHNRSTEFCSVNLNDGDDEVSDSGAENSDAMSGVSISVSDEEAAAPIDEEALADRVFGKREVVRGDDDDLESIEEVDADALNDDTDEIEEVDEAATGDADAMEADDAEAEAMPSVAPPTLKSVTMTQLDEAAKERVEEYAALSDDETAMSEDVDEDGVEKAQSDTEFALE